MSRYLTATGLVLDIIGALLLFKFGLPPDFDPLGRNHIMLEQLDREERKKGIKYRFWGRFGLGCLIVGFIGQLAGVWVQ